MVAWTNATTSDTLEPKPTEPRSPKRLFTALVVAWLLLSAVGFYGYQSYAKERFEDPARHALIVCRNAQLTFRNDPKRGNGTYADSMETLGLRLFDNGNITDDGPAYRIETSKEGCTARATHPELVANPALRIDYESATIKPLP